MTEPTLESTFYGRRTSCLNAPSYDEAAWSRLYQLFYAARNNLEAQERILEYARALSEESELPKQLSDFEDRSLSGFRLVTCFLPMEESALVPDLGHHLWARDIITQRVIACSNEELAHLVVARLPQRSFRIHPLLLIADTERGFGFSTRNARPIDERRITILTQASFMRVTRLLSQPFTWTSDLGLSATI